MYYIFVAKSLVILGCSDRKKLTSRPLRALERYDGPTFRVLRKHVRENPGELIHIRILSARFGLISDDVEIPSYNRSLSESDKTEFRLRVEVQIRQTLRDVRPERVFVSLGRRYWTLVEKPLVSTTAFAKVFVAAGGIGGRASQLGWWLGTGQDESSDRISKPPAGVATLLGTTVRLSAGEVLSAASDALVLNPAAARRFETWYVPVGAERVAPKWLASVVFDKPVARFRTADARRVLAHLGVECIYASGH